MPGQLCCWNDSNCYQKDLTDDSGGRGPCGHCGRGERGSGIADVDAVHPPVSGQRTFKEERVEAERHRARLDAHNPGQPQDHPWQAGRSHVVLDFCLVRAVEIRRLERGVLAQPPVMPVRVAGAVHRIAGSLNEPRRTRT
jgi:hypothetical protein